MEQPHRTIARSGQHEIEIRKSRFICTLFRVDSEDEARERIDQIRRRYWDANHNCTAWIIGSRQQLQRSSDDGEPAGTAGTPMLEVLRRRGLTDTLAIVTRYFGGVLLGAGGLIRAYGQAVSEAIDAIGIVERRPLAVRRLVVPYDAAGRIEHAIRSSAFRLVDVRYGGEVTFELLLEPQEVTPFAHWVAEQSNGSLVPEDGGLRHVEIPVLAPDPA